MKRLGIAGLVGALFPGGAAWFASRLAAPTPEEQASARAEHARRQVEALEKLGYLSAGRTEEPERAPVPER